MKSQAKSLTLATTSTEHHRHWRPPYYVKGLALGIPIYLTAVHLWTWILLAPPLIRRGEYDFRQSYAAAYMVRTRHALDLYDYSAQKEFQDKLVSPQETPLPFVAPAYEALFMVPLSFFSFRTAYFLFLGVNLVALGLSFFLLVPWMRNLEHVYSWLPLALFLGFLPIGAALIQGQDSILLTLILVASFRALTTRHETLAGLLLGAGLFKFPLVLPLVLLFVIWRRWRVLMGFAISAAVVLVLCILLIGIHGLRGYVQLLLSLAGLTHTTNALALREIVWSNMANIHGLLFGIAHGFLSARALEIAVLTTAATVLVWTAFRGSRISSNSACLLLLAIPCSVLVSHHAYIHDLSILILPTVVLLNQSLPHEGRQKTERLSALVAAIMFASPVVVSYAPRYFCVVALAVLGMLVVIPLGLQRRSEEVPGLTGL